MSLSAVAKFKRALRVASCTALVVGGAMLITAPTVSAQTETLDAKKYPPKSVPPRNPPPRIVDNFTPTTAPTTTSTTTTTTIQVLGAAITQPTTTEKVKAAPAITPEVRGAVVRAPAYTGSNAYPLAVAGLALFGLGSALVVGARRRNKKI